jgi:hypothetical protein
MTPCAFQIQARDNVATLLDEAPPGAIRILGAAPTGALVEAIEPIPRSHKVALEDIEAHHEVIKYGVPIGQATQRIARGSWVHLHNLASRLDERSGTLDVHSGAPTDTASAYV